MITLAQTKDLVGATAYTHDDHKLGTVRSFVLDDRTGVPGFVGIETGLLGRSTTWVPVLQASFNDTRLTVPYDEDLVKAAPDADLAEDGRLEPEAERALREHYRVEEEYADEPPTHPAPGTPGAPTDQGPA